MKRRPHIGGLIREYLLIRSGKPMWYFLLAVVLFVMGFGFVVAEMHWISFAAVGLAIVPAFRGWVIVNERWYQHLTQKVPKKQNLQLKIPEIKTISTQRDPKYIRIDNVRDKIEESKKLIYTPIYAMRCIALSLCLAFFYLFPIWPLASGTSTRAWSAFYSVVILVPLLAIFESFSDADQKMIDKVTIKVIDYIESNNYTKLELKIIHDISINHYPKYKKLNSYLENRIS